MNKIIRESFFPNFDSELRDAINLGWRVIDTYINKEDGYFWALLEKR